MEYELASKFFIVSFPTFIIILCSYTLWLINRRYRKNILKKIFSLMLFSFILYSSVNLVRFFHREAFLFWARIVVSFNSFFMILYLLLSYGIYRGGEINKKHFSFFLIPVVLTIITWQPNSLTLADSNYVPSLYLHLPYFATGIFVCFSTPVLFYLSYKKYRGVSNKLKYFFYASLIPVLSFPLFTTISFVGKMKIEYTIFQIYVFSITILLMIYGYLKR